MENDHQNDSTERVLKVALRHVHALSLIDHQNDSTERVLKDINGSDILLGAEDHQNDSTERVLKGLSILGLKLRVFLTIKTTRQSEY